MYQNTKDILLLDKLFPFSIMDQQLQPNYDMGGLFHWHECLEIAYVKSGTGRYYIEDRIYEINLGDIIIINNLEPHHIEVDAAGMHQTVIIFEPSLVVEGAGQMSDYDYLSPFFDRGSDFSNKLDTMNPLYIEIMNNLLDMEKEYILKTQGYQLMIKAKLLVLLTLLVRNFRDSLRKNTKRIQQVLRIDEALKYIDMNLSKDIYLKEVASWINITPQYFSVTFKTIMGITFTDYVSRERIYKAITMLKQTNDTVTQIAFNCGFNNTMNFNTTFRKITGKTPSEYKHELKEG